MPWTLTEGEEGYLLCHLTGHIAEPYGVITDQAKAIHLIEVLEWAEVLGKAGVIPAPPRFKPKRGAKRAP
jgi:hypothetical protein